jgi:hypothetical protein
MSSSLREQVIARMVVALTGTTPAGNNVQRAREVSIARAQTPAVVIMPSSTDLNRVASGADKNVFEVRIEIFVRGEPWDSQVDPIDVAAHAIVMTDAGLAALVSDIRRVSEAFESQEADATAGTLTVTYRMTWMGRAADLTRPA